MKPVAIMAGAAAVALGYVGAHALGLPMVWLDSALGTWSFGARPSTASMDYFGRSAWALSLGVAAAVALSRLTVGARGARAVAMVAAAVIAGAFALEASRLSTRAPVAEDFPEGYDPVTGRTVVPAPTRLAEP